MFINSYEKPADFLEGTSNHHPLIKSAYVRKSMDGGISNEQDLRSLFLGALPILGSIRGLARLYSVWSVKDRSGDAQKDVTAHTIVGILEVLGFGPIFLALNIALAVIGIFSIIAIGVIGLFCHGIKCGVKFLTKPCLPNKC
ncbi:hypothetical protein SBV45_03850 [Chlamydia crocodili]|uniref:hypothetical protein n=1 Tax=Chlamydia TaxID=810 RepID=UPI0020162A74|nr:hypothetical protein [Chlamydia crocodili]